MQERVHGGEATPRVGSLLGSRSEPTRGEIAIRVDRKRKDGSDSWQDGFEALLLDKDEIRDACGQIKNGDAVPAEQGRELIDTTTRVV